LRICTVYGTRKEITQRETAEFSSIGTHEKKKTKINKRITKKKDEDNTEDKGFQQPKGTVTVIFSRVLGSRSKHQDKMALRSIMAAEPTVPRYLSWS
jgi:hypothetical protein